MIFFGVFLVPLVICREKRDRLLLALSVSLAATSKGYSGYPNVDLSPLNTVSFPDPTFLLVSTEREALVAAGFAYSFSDYPNATVYAEIGGKVTAFWLFQIEPKVVKSRTQIEDFIFGEWGPPGYVKHKILYLDSNYKVRPRPGYEDKVRCELNISQINCSAQVTILELKRSDFKIYGIDILVGLDRSPLINTFELRAPPRIEFFSSGLVVAQGNKTAFECRAKGIPEPFVTIKRANETLCNGTSHCHWAIENVDIEDEGEYECIAKQGERSVKRSERLTVQLRTDDGNSAKESFNTLVVAIVLAAVAVVLVVPCAIWFCKRAKNKVYRFQKVEGKPFEI